MKQDGQLQCSLTHIVFGSDFKLERGTKVKISGWHTEMFSPRTVLWDWQCVLKSFCRGLVLVSWNKGSLGRKTSQGGSYPNHVATAWPACSRVAPPSMDQSSLPLRQLCESCDTLTVLSYSCACTRDNHVGLSFVSNPKDKKEHYFFIFIFQLQLACSITLLSGVHNSD